MDEESRTQIESQAFRALMRHLQDRKDVQNIDLMNLAGFCRNCLAKWVQKAAEDEGLSMDKMESREFVYGMPYSEWKEKYQK